MPDNTIDTLELQIISNSEKAASSLDNLAKKLLEVNNAFTSLNSRGLSNYAERIKNLGSAIKSITGIKMQIPEISGATKEVDRMETYIQNASKRISKSLADALNINTSDVRGNIQEIGELLSAGNKSGAVDATEELADEMIKIAKNAKYADEQMQAFYETVVNAGKIKIPSSLPKSMPDEWKNMDGLLRQKMSTQVGTELDSLMQEWKDKFSNLFSDFSTDTVQDQFTALNEVIKQCRNGITSPLANSGMLSDAVWEQLYPEMVKFESEIKSVKSVLESTGGTKITENIGMDKFISDIRKLSSIKTEGLAGIAHGISEFSSAIQKLNGISIDTGAIEKTLEALKEIGKKKNISNTESLKQVSSNVQEFANSVSSVESLTQALSRLSGLTFDGKNLSKVIKSIKELMAAQNADFNTQAFTEIEMSMRKIATIPDVSTALNKFIASLQRLANAGGGIETVASELPRLGDSLRTMVRRMETAGDISDSVNLFVQSISRLASAGSKVGVASNGLDNLAKEVLKFFETMEKAPEIKENTLQMVKALAQLEASGGRVGAATNETKSAFEKLSKVGSKTASAIKKVASGIVSSFAKIGGAGKNIRKASSGFTNLLKSAIPYVGAYKLFDLGKQAVQLSSDLTEVQNVVDVAFGSMKQKVEDLASISISDFGMSELTAKQISSRFQAMGTAMGFSQEKMSDMSIELTKLAADMASFYNVEQNDVAKSLQSVFTGETEPLRKYGLDLTNATVQEWALKQGIDANMQSMTQAEKTLLRYQYVMENTSAAQGDFARTSGTWANQVRILSQRFQELGTIVGGTLINALKPLVTALNSVMGKVIEFVRTISEALGAIFGWKIEVSAAGITDDLAGSVNDVASGAEDAAGGLSDATGAAKELKKALSVLPFDELNQLASNLSDTSNPGGGGNEGGDGGGTTPGGSGGANTAIVPTESLFEKYKSEIKNLEQLGEYISTSLTEAMRKINWNSIYDQAKNFGSGLADFLNGLISPALFKETGRLIANSLNTALFALNSFGKKFKWDNFGNSIAEGINGFFRNFKFGLLADTIDTWVNGIADTILHTVDNTEWGTIGKRIGSFLKNTIEGIDFDKIADIFSSSFNGIFDFLKNFNAEKPFAGLGSKISSALNRAMSGIETGEAANAIGTAIESLLSELVDAVTTTDWDLVGKNVREAIEGIPWKAILTTVGRLIWAAINAGISFWKGLFGIDTIEDKINGISEELDLTKLSDGIERIGEALSPFVQGVAEGFINVIDFLVNTVTPAAIKLLGESFHLLADALNSLPPEVLNSIGKSLGEIGASLLIIKGASAAITSLKGLFTFLGGTKAAADTAGQALEGVGEAATATGNAARTTSSIIGKFNAGLLNSGATILFSDAIKNIGKELDGTAEKSRNADEAFMLVSGALHEAGLEGDFLGLKMTGVEEPMRHLYNEDAPEFASAFSEVVRKFEEAGGSTDEFKSALESALSSGLGISKEYADVITQYIKGTGETFSSTSEEISEASTSTANNVGGISDSLSAINDTSLLSIAKFALLAGALKTLADNGLISENEFLNLSTSLSNANSSGSGFDTVISEISESLTNAGISVGDLNDALATSASNMKGTFPEAVGEVTSALKTLEANMSESGTNAAKNYVSGVENGFKDNSSIATSAAEEVAKDTDTAVTSTWQEHSPSKLAKEHGMNYVQGLANGIKENVSEVLSQVKEMLDSIQTLFTGKYSDMQLFGQEYATMFLNGLNSGEESILQSVSNITSSIENSINSLSNTLYNSGRSAAQSFANGISSVHIPMPHISVQASTSATENGYSYSMNSSVNWYGKGALFNNPAIIGIGEAGSEVALPLENRKTMSMIADSILSNASGIGLSEDAIVNAVSRGVAMAMMNNSGNNTPINVYATLKTENDEVLARAVARGQEKIDYRFNPTPQYG